MKLRRSPTWVVVADQVRSSATCGSPSTTI
jgi:hypothetical protein